MLVFFVLFLLLYTIVSRVHKFTHHCHRVETQVQLIHEFTVIAYKVSDYCSVCEQVTKLLTLAVLEAVGIEGVCYLGL